MRRRGEEKKKGEIERTRKREEEEERDRGREISCHVTQGPPPPYCFCAVWGSTCATRPRSACCLLPGSQESEPRCILTKEKTAL